MNKKSRNWLLIGIVFGFIVFLRATTSRAPDPTEYFALPTPMVIAHQGGDGLRPSNTLEAFELAVELGVDVLEMDLHSTRDGQLVVMHDATVDRTTNGTGRIQDMSLVELKTLDAGWHWPYQGTERPYRNRGVRVPKLTEVLERYPGLRFNIEIKQAEPDIGADLCRLLQDHAVAARTLVASFQAETVENFRRVCPGVATSAHESEVVWFLIYQKLRLVWLLHPAAHALQLPLERRGFDLTKPAMFEAAHRRGLHVDNWTVNDEATMRRLIAAGVGGIITDRPDLLLEVLSRSTGDP